MRFVTLNGPMQCGKSWVVRNLESRFHTTKFVRMSFQDTLARATQTLLGAEHMDYETFKKTDFYGRTGRQHMIDVANEKRRHDPYFFSRVLHSRMNHDFHKTRVTMRQPVYIADSNGFPDELDFFRVQEDIDLLPCSIEPDEHKNKRGQLYGEGDSRFNLADKCNVVTVDSTLMLDALSAALKRRDWV